MFLTREQIREMTGYARRKQQIEWLRRNGVKHWVAATGYPVVPCSAIDGTPAQRDDSGPQPELGDVA